MFDVFFQHFYILGKGWIVILIGMILLKLKKQYFWRLLTAVTIETCLVHILKFAIKAPRPASMLEDVHLIEGLYHGSFPSGDTALTFVVATCFYYGSTNYIKILLFVYALLVAYGRMYLGVHFPLDIFVGGCIGISSGMVANLLVKLYKSKNKKWQNS
ncbi:MAG: phosphatase PAP2 family protein [Syntrophobacterales bacterium]|nr:phosphatase PAP2 family protein [Syntrophobacterales bacterium]